MIACYEEKDDLTMVSGFSIILNIQPLTEKCVKAALVSTKDNRFLMKVWKTSDAYVLEIIVV